MSRSSEGQTIRWEHELNGYTVTSNLSFEGFNSSLGDEFVFMWEAEGMPNEKGIDWERQHSSIYYKEVGLGRDYLTDGQSKDLITEEPWNGSHSSKTSSQPSCATKATSCPVRV